MVESARRLRRSPGKPSRERGWRLTSSRANPFSSFGPPGAGHAARSSLDSTRWRRSTPHAGSASMASTCWTTIVPWRALSFKSSRSPTRAFTTHPEAWQRPTRSTRRHRSCWSTKRGSSSADIRGRRPAHSWNDSSIRSWLLRPTLPARRLEHLLVFVFAHFLSALLDYRAQSWAFVVTAPACMSRNILDDAGV